MTLLIILAIVSIAFSFLCSILEAVILSVTPSYSLQLSSTNPALGAQLKEYKENIDRPLSAILTLNTIAHTVGAIMVGNQAGKIYGDAGMNILNLNVSFVTIVASIMTLAILILSEIIPKTIGANYWKGLTPVSIRILKIIIFLLSPLVWLSELITKFMKKDKERSVLSRADFSALTAVATEEGEIDTQESAIINNLLRLKDWPVSDIMTPRTVLLMCEKNRTIQSFYEEHDPIPFSRIPVYAESSDEVIGFMLKDELLQELAEDRNMLTVEELVHPIHEIGDDSKLLPLYQEMIKKNIHMSIVRDQYGSLVGVVTLEDLMESLLGAEIVDEFDVHEDMQELAKRKRNNKLKN